MTKRRFFILTSLVFFILTALFITSYLFQKKYMLSLAKSDLTSTGSELSQSINSAFLEKKMVLDGLEKYIRSTLDIDRAMTDRIYYESYINSLDPILIHLAYSFEDAYVIFLEDFFGSYHDRWFFDTNRDGIPEKMPELTKDYFDGDLAKKAWFYKPIAEKEPVWIEPYESSVLSGVTFVTLTHPIVYRNDIAILVGLDFEFTKFYNTITQLNSDNRSSLYLLNNDKKIILQSESQNSNDTIQQDQIIFSEQVASRQMLKTSIFEYSDSRGSKILGFFNKLDNGWYIGASTNLSELNPLSENEILLLYLFIYLSTLGILIIPYYLQWRILEQSVALSPHNVEEPNIPITDAIDQESIQLHTKLIACEKQCTQMKETLDILTEEYANKVISMTLQSYLRQLESPLYILKKSENQSSIDFDKESIQTAIDDALTILTHAQHYSRTCNAREWVPIPIKQLIKETIDIFLILYDQKSIELKLDIPQESFITNNTFLIQQVFAFLALNSMENHFRSQASYFIEISLTKTAHFIVIDYKDNGQPFNAELINLALNPYFEDLYYSSQIGLPLYVLRSLVHHRLMGAIQTVTSDQLNHFKINLPL